MIANSLVRKVVRAEYSLLRGSMQVFDARVASRYLPDNSPVRAVFGRGLTVLDAAAARLLHVEPQPGQPSSTAPSDAATDTTATTDASTTDASTTDASTTDASTTDDSTAGDSAAQDSAADASVEDVRVEDVPVEEVERVAEELLEERSETPLTGELAEESQDDALTMAELRAKHIVEEYEMQQREKSQD